MNEAYKNYMRAKRDNAPQNILDELYEAYVEAVHAAQKRGEVFAELYNYADAYMKHTQLLGRRVDPLECDFQSRRLNGPKN